MGLATVITDIAPLYERPSAESGRTDEVLYGMSVQIMQESDAGWCYLRTEHNTEGYTPTACLESDPDVAAAWRKYHKMVVLAPYIDVNKMPDSLSGRVGSLPRGGILVALAKTADDGWIKVGLPNGSVGYTRSSYLGDIIADGRQLAEEDLRWNIVETALSYNGTAYRAGGRTPLGMDSAGLAAMSYGLNGITIPREAFFKTGGVLRPVAMDKMGEGDLLYFQQGMGLYIGNGKFVHATELPGCEGVIVNSLRPKDDEYRADLAGNIIVAASLF